jgi:hypothetical protein
VDPDPYVFGPPGSGSISTRYGSGSRSFFHQAKMIRKTLISEFLSLKNDGNVASKINRKKNKEKKYFWLPS